MSTIFHIRCELCEVDGPKIRRAPGGTALQEDHADDYYQVREGDAPQVCPTWTSFLIEHEYHGGSNGGLILVHE